MTPASNGPAAVMSEQDWAVAVATDIGLESDTDVERVSQVLVAAGIRPGRPRSRHRLQVRAVYFAGLKHVMADRSGGETASADTKDESGMDNSLEFEVVLSALA